MLLKDEVGISLELNELREETKAVLLDCRAALPEAVDENDCTELVVAMKLELELSLGDPDELEALSADALELLEGAWNSLLEDSEEEKLLVVGWPIALELVGATPELVDGAPEVARLELCGAKEALLDGAADEREDGAPEVARLEL